MITKNYVIAASSSESDDLAPIPPQLPASDEPAAGGVDEDQASAKAKPRGKRSADKTSNHRSRSIE
jgi:hypothetical protein